MLILNLILCLTALVAAVLFKVQSNRESSEKKYALLWNLGINDAVLDKTRKTEAEIVFIIPSFAAVCIGVLMTIGLIKISL